MATYTINIALDSATISALSSGFQLQVFKGVKASSLSGALPTIWTTINQFANTIEISWSDNYGGYFSNTMIQSGASVNIGTQAGMNPGDVITLGMNGSSSVSSAGGVQGAFTFISEQTTIWTSGLTASANQSSPTPICAFPQYGSVDNLLEPYESVLLLFTQDQMSSGTIIRTAVTESISIRLSSTAPSSAVSYNINTGWDITGSPSANIYPSNTELAPVLIVNSPN